MGQEKNKSTSTEQKKENESNVQDENSKLIKENEELKKEKEDRELADLEKEENKKIAKTAEAEKAEKMLKEKQALSREEYNDTNEKAKSGLFIVVHTIKEDGKVFEKGKSYTGKNEKRYLHNGQIREKD